ncbi:hypothetical protein VTN00DRAFT_801 [Thermoascus crustaceus]|uniref:uncharacterized protein n=1 Tax=Thermoascus crustaceus TaxID=5088 RepID=UPI00374340E0
MVPKRPLDEGESSQAKRPANMLPQSLHEQGTMQLFAHEPISFRSNAHRKYFKKNRIPHRHSLIPQKLTSPGSTRSHRASEL